MEEQEEVVLKRDYEQNRNEEMRGRKSKKEEKRESTVVKDEETEIKVIWRRKTLTKQKRAKRGLNTMS